jgi:hypothetical protein
MPVSRVQSFEYLQYSIRRPKMKNSIIALPLACAFLSAGAASAQESVAYAGSKQAAFDVARSVAETGGGRVVAEADAARGLRDRRDVLRQIVTAKTGASGVTTFESSTFAVHDRGIGKAGHRFAVIPVTKMVSATMPAFGRGAKSSSGGVAVSARADDGEVITTEF